MDDRAIFYGRLALKSFTWALFEISRGWYKVAASTLVVAEVEADLAASFLPPLKVCACGARHSIAAWERLPLVGVHDDGVERFVLRSCTCRSTIAVSV